MLAGLAPTACSTSRPPGVRPARSTAAIATSMARVRMAAKAARVNAQG